jgi:hypothetical protein
LRLPFAPDAFEGLPSVLSLGAIEQAVLRGLLDPQAANLTVGGDTHDLQPGSDRKAMIEGEPDEGAHLFWSGVMPDSGDGLTHGGVPKAESLYEREHVRWPHEVTSVDVTSFSSVAKEGGVSKGRGGLPMPLPRVPGEILNEARFKNLEDWSFLARCFQLLGDSKAQLGTFL